MMAHILVVDDSEVLRRIVVFNLVRNGYTVSEASDGEEALQKLKESTPDLVILDIMMPKMNGFEVLKVMKQDENLSKVPVIVLTAKGGENDLQEGLKLGADIFLTKPFSPGRLVEEVQRVINNG
ncbi:MAG: two-component system response regulator [Thermotogae bacterium]|nr:MAG: two-component system response regulator [Thermotogota bacterium]